MDPTAQSDLDGVVLCFPSSLTWGTLADDLHEIALYLPGAMSRFESFQVFGNPPTKGGDFQ
jgi:hypothetical protein